MGIHPPSIRLQREVRNVPWAQITANLECQVNIIEFRFYPKRHAEPFKGLSKSLERRGRRVVKFTFEKATGAKVENLEIGKTLAGRVF